MSLKQNHSVEANEIDELIRSGQFELAHRQLKTIIKSDLSRRNLLGVCSQLRRIDQSELALKLLREKIETDKDPGLMVEYCRNLQILGISSEPLLRLARFDQLRLTDALFVKAQALASGWNYGRLVTILNQVLIEESDFYKRLIAHLNICSATLFLDEFEYARQYSLDIVNSCRSHQFDLLESHALELHAQCLIYDGRWRDAEEYIDLALSKLKSDNSRYIFYKRKWKAIIELGKTGSRVEVDQVCEEAKQNEMWEVLRSIDFEIARITKDRELIQKLYAGTPSAQFRDMLAKYFGPQETDYFLNGPRKGVLNLSTGKFGDAEIFGASKKVLKLLQILCSDFYKPFSMGRLFSALYPGEMFDAANSIPRVKRLLGRARKLLRDQKLGIEIVEKNRLYYLDNGAGCSIELDLGKTTGDDSIYVALLHHFGNDVFRSQDVQDHLECSRYGVQAALKDLIESGRLLTFGAGRSTVYYFPPDHS